MGNYRIMNKTLLAPKDGELLENLIAKHGKVVSTQHIHAEADSSWSDQYIKKRIGRLVDAGWLIRIKRGLYAISDLSSRGFLTTSPYAVAHLLVGESYVSFEAALAYHGMFDQFTDQYRSVALRQYKTVQLKGIQYQFIKTKKTMYIGWERVEVEGLNAQIARPEKALVDMIYFRKSHYAVDLVIEKLCTHEADTALLAQYAGARRVSGPFAV